MNACKKAAAPKSSAKPLSTVEKIIPNVVVKGDDKEEVDTLWQVDYQRLVPHLIKAVQELSAKVEALENA